MAALIGLHVMSLPEHIAHPKDDISFIWKADSTVVINISLWQQMAPPFAHAVIVLILACKDARVIDVMDVKRVSFGA
ncbi:hypothetical protein Q0601_05180 [Paracoccus onubensis]|uniref:hypothetical protein n=1 Tax=Paracoccus onubensis TaxID=1675788 RepID=UPI00272F0218|nr:hypothetical protein [Paracoccus onubensis]MDP0926552.1 hypothetical protein [Paracoccus onubensis]